MPDRVKKKQPVPGLDSKICIACGRAMQWRKSWSKNWNEVKFCSDRCRASKPGDTEQSLEESILLYLRNRGAGKTSCLSDIARAIGGEGRDGWEGRYSWEELMDPLRKAARRLAARGEINIIQGGVVVDGSTAKGPIQVCLK